MTFRPAPLALILSLFCATEFAAEDPEAQGPPATILRAVANGDARLIAPSRVDPYRFVRARVEGSPAGAALSWRVYPRAKVDRKTDGTELIFVAPPGEYEIECDVIDFEARTLQQLDPVTVTISAAGDNPLPPPGKGTAAHFTFVVTGDSGEAELVNSNEFRNYLWDNKIKPHVVRATDPYIKQSGLTTAVEQAGGAPCIIVQDDSGKVLSQATMGTFDQAKALLKPYLENPK